MGKLEIVTTANPSSNADRITTLGCGCKIHVWEGLAEGLERCPLHKAAPDMLAELQSISDMLTRTDWTDRDFNCLEDSVNAIITQATN